MKDKEINFKKESGQSTIEFLVSFSVIFTILLTFVRIAFNATNGFYAHYAVFNASRAYLVSDENELVGKVALAFLVSQKSGAPLESVSDLEPLSIKHDASLQQAIEVASGFVGESIPVLDKENTLLGVITEADLFSQYLEVQSTISSIEKD